MYFLPLSAYFQSLYWLIDIRCDVDENVNLLQKKSQYLLFKLHYTACESLHRLFSFVYHLSNKEYLILLKWRWEISVVHSIFLDTIWEVWNQWQLRTAFGPFSFLPILHLLSLVLFDLAVVLPSKRFRHTTTSFYSNMRWVSMERWCRLTLILMDIGQHHLYISILSEKILRT